jgi:hypothetical protein
VQKFVRDRSDHNPLILSLNNEHVKEFHSFRYELFWGGKEDDFLGRVEKASTLPVSGKDELSCVNLKPKMIKMCLKGFRQ